MLKGNRVILPIDVIKYILKRWYVVIIVAVVVAGLYTGYSYYKDSKAVAAQAQKDAQAKEYDIDDFTEEEFNTVQNAVDAYTTLKNTQNYYDNSYIQKVDPFAVERTTLRIMVEVQPESDDEEDIIEAESTSNLLRNKYYQYVQKGDLGKAIAEKIGVEPQYITEIVGVENEGNTIFSVLLYASDMVPDFSQTAQIVLEEYRKELEINNSKHTLTVTDEFETVLRVDDYYNRQRNSTSEINTCTNNLNNLLNKMSMEQVAYYNEQTGNEFVYLNQETKEPEGRYESIGKVGLIKKAVIGGALGVILSCVIELLKYMYSVKVISETDYIYSLGVTYLGNDKNETEKKLSVEKALNACKKNDVKKIVLSGTNDELLKNKIKMQIKEALDKEGIEVKCIEGIMEDSEKMKELLETGNLLLLEGIGKSKLMKINEVVDLCTDCKVNLLGIINISVK